MTIGDRLGPYEVLAKLGEGGMGEVYRARDTRLGRDVAIKVLRNPADDEPERTARFKREAQVLASLNHPNIGGIHGLEESDGRYALVLELVEGSTLADRIASGPVPLDEAIAIARQIAVALEAAHEYGIVHRDLKPANIKVRPDGTVTRPIPSPPSARFEIATPPTSNLESLAMSPDGRMIVYAATTQAGSNLWLRDLDALTPRMLPGTQDGTRPFWSPDSRTVGFFASGALKRVEIAGGTAQVVTSALNGFGGAWSRDGTIVFVPNAAPQILMRVPASGGRPTPVETTTPQPQQFSQSNPQFLPDGRHFIYAVSGPPEVSGVYIAGLEGLAAHRLIDANAGVYSAGQLFFGRQGTIFGQPLDLADRKLTGEPVRVADEAASLTASANGVVIYRTGSAVVQRRFRWFDRQGKTIGDVDGGENLEAPAVSPDGRRIAAYAEINGNVDVWMVEGRGVRTRFTVEPAVDNFPIWSPDGTQVAFSSTRLGGPHNLFVKPVAGGESTLLISTDEVKTGNDWSSDGKYILFRSSSASSSHDLWAVSVSDRQAFPVVKTRFAERDGVFSPDTKWIAYQSDESGRFEVYMQAFPKAGPRTQISTAGGAQVRWSRDGRELFVTRNAG